MGHVEAVELQVGESDVHRPGDLGCVAVLEFEAEPTPPVERYQAILWGTERIERKNGRARLPPKILRGILPPSARIGVRFPTYRGTLRGSGRARPIGERP